MSYKVVGKILKPVDELVASIDGMDITDHCVVDTECEELKPIAETVTSMAERVTEYVSEVEKTARIRQEFSANVSHELKTPLTTIKGFGELLDGGLITDPEDVKKYGGIIFAESSRLLSLINDIMRIAEIDSMPAGMFETVNLKKCCEDAIEILYMKAAKNDIKVMFTGRTVLVSGIATHLCEVIANLIDNAIKYNRPGGSVWIKLRREENAAVLSVRDNGIGIPEGSLDRIFERFYRVDKSRSRQSGGTGLGLAIVKHIVQYHNGTVQVFSQEGVGTEFVLRFNAL